MILWDSSILNLYLCIQLLWFHFVQTSRWWSFEKNASSVFLCYCTFHSTVSSLFHKIIRVSSSLSLSQGVPCILSAYCIVESFCLCYSREQLSLWLWCSQTCSELSFAVLNAFILVNFHFILFRCFLDNDVSSAVTLFLWGI
jgi:hypothetical protein